MNRSLRPLLATALIAATAMAGCAAAPMAMAQPPTPTPNAMDHSPARDTLTDADEGLVPALLLALTRQRTPAI